MVHDDLHIAVFASFTVIAIVGLIGNVIVISCFLRFSKLRTITNTYILNLTVSSLCSCIVIGIHVVLYAVHDHQWPLSETLCNLYGTTADMNVYSCVIFSMILCVDRYLAIVWPTSRTRFVSNVVMTASWIAGALLAIPTSIFMRVQNRICVDTSSDDEDYARAIAVTVYKFTVPFVVIVICNVLIAQRLKNVGYCNRSSQVGCSMNYTTRKVSMLVILITTFLTVCKIPFYVSHMAHVFRPQSRYNDSPYVAVITSDVIHVLGTVMLPVMYALLNDNYRKCVLKLFTCAAVGDVNASLREEGSEQGSVSEYVMHYRSAATSDTAC